MSVSPPPLDILDSGSREARPRRRAALVALAAVGLALLAGGWAEDQHRRRTEYAALTGCADRARAAASAAAAPVETMANYVRPSLAFAQEFSAAGLYGKVAAAAAATGPGLREARQACAEVDVRGRHDELRAARTARLTSLDAELDLLRRTAADGRSWFDLPTDLTRLRRDADAALAAAAPQLP